MCYPDQLFLAITEILKITNLQQHQPSFPIRRPSSQTPPIIPTFPLNLSNYTHLHHLLTALSLSSTRALETLVISTIYAGLLVAKLDTKSQRVDVSSISPLRDLRPAKVRELISTLDTWNGRCVSVLDDLENHIKEVRQKALERRKREQRDEAAVEKLMGQALKDRGKAGEKRMAQDPVAGREAVMGEGIDGMDLDEKAGPGRPRGAKRGGGAFKNAAKRMMG